jgi:hypothetical protein
VESDSTTRRESLTCSIFDDASIGAAVDLLGKAREKEHPGVERRPGGVIHVDDLGDIYLGQLSFERDPEGEYRRLTMLRVVLGSPPSGDMSFGSVEGDGRLG